MLDTMVNPVIFTVYMDLYLAPGEEQAGLIVEELLALCSPLQFNGVMPATLVCSEENFLIVLLKHSQHIARRWDREEFLRELRLIYNGKNEIDPDVNIDPLNSLRWLLRRSRE
jgi:hypothetical protein